MTHPVQRDVLYAITDSNLIPATELAARVAQAIAGGATVIQYREKQLATAERHRQAAQLTELSVPPGYTLARTTRPFARNATGSVCAPL